MTHIKKYTVLNYKAKEFQQYIFMLHLMLYIAAKVLQDLFCVLRGHVFWMANDELRLIKIFIIRHVAM